MKKLAGIFGQILENAIRMFISVPMQYQVQFLQKIDLLGKHLSVGASIASISIFLVLFLPYGKPGIKIRGKISLLVSVRLTK